MARRRPPRTRACLGHLVYRSQYEAMRCAAWHPAWSCVRCRNGFVWHAFRHESHWHVGHSTVSAMARQGAQ